MNDLPVFHRKLANLLFLIISSWAMTIWLPLRRYCGKDYLGIRAIMGWMVIATYAWIANDPVMDLLIPIYLLAILLRICGQIKLRFQGVIQHTRYDGDPWLARLVLFSKDENKCKSVGEPALAIMTGYFLLSTSDALGAYLIIGGFAMFLVQAVAERQYQRRIDEINNGRIENAVLMRHFHHERGRRTR